MPTSRDDDLALVNACLERSDAAWTSLVQDYETTVYYAILNAFRVHGKSPDQDTILELQAEVFYRLVRDDFARLRSYSGRSGLRHWLKVVAGNFVIDTLRKRRPDCSLDDPAHAQARADLADPAPSPERQVAAGQARRDLDNLYRCLPQSDQLFVKLYYREGLSFEVIAQRMNTTVGAIYSRKNRVRKRLEAEARRVAASTDRRRWFVEENG